jgi:hypothetical protein
MRGLRSPMHAMLKSHHPEHIGELTDATDRVMALAREVARTSHLRWWMSERRRLRTAIVTAGKGLDTVRFQHVLGLALAMVRRSRMPSDVVLETVDWPSDLHHFHICLDLALRLVERQESPKSLAKTMWLLGFQTTTPADIENQCASLGDLFATPHIKQWTSWASVLSHCAKSLSPARFQAALAIAARQIDLPGYLKAAAVFKPPYTDAQFYALLDWLAELKGGLNAGVLERFPVAVSSLPWSRFLGVLDASRDLVAKGVPLEIVIAQILNPAADIATTPEEFTKILTALRSLAGGKARDRTALERLDALPRTGVSARRLLRIVEMFKASAGVHAIALRAGVDAAAKAASDLAFDTCMTALGLLIAHADGDLDGSRRSARLLALPQADMSLGRFLRCATLIERTRGTNLMKCATALRGSLEAASRLAESDVQFDVNIAAIERFFSPDQSGIAHQFDLSHLHLPARLDHPERFAMAFDAAAPLIAIRPKVSEIFEGIWHAASSPDDFDARLAVLKRIAIALENQKLAANISPGIGALIEQAMHLLYSYEDFALVLHPALTTTEETYTDSYYGTTTSNTVVDRPEWLEVRPAGERTRPLTLALADLRDLRLRLEMRSWLWQHAVGNVDRERALERCATLRAFLFSLLDRLMRAGLLDADAHVESVFVIGSYPWVAQPNDIDLFIVVRGEQDVIERPAAAVSAHDVRVTGLLAPPAIEVVGRDTLLAAARGAPVRYARALVQRLALLHASPLLAGDDLPETSLLPEDIFRQMVAGLRSNAKKYQGAKQQWRETEARALESFLRARQRVAQTKKK